MCPAVPATQVMALLSIPRPSTAEHRGPAGHVSDLWGQDVTHPLVTWPHAKLLMCQCTLLATGSSEIETIIGFLMYLTASATSTHTYCCPSRRAARQGTWAVHVTRNHLLSCQGKGGGENAVPKQLESLRGLIPNNFSLLALAWKWEETVYSCEELDQR